MGRQGRIQKRSGQIIRSLRFSRGKPWPLGQNQVVEAAGNLDGMSRAGLPESFKAFRSALKVLGGDQPMQKEEKQSIMNNDSGNSGESFSGVPPESQKAHVPDSDVFSVGLRPEGQLYQPGILRPQGCPPATDSRCTSCRWDRAPASSRS
jgi:hypothetical protein